MKDQLDSGFNKLRAEAVLELIRKHFRDDCTDEHDASGGHMAYMHLVSLFFIALEARGFDSLHYEQHRDAAMRALHLGENDLRGARREAVDVLALSVTGQGISLTYGSEAMPF